MIQIEPIGVDRDTAAALLSISTTALESRVRDGTLPKPRKLGGRAVWLVRELREAADLLPVSDLLPPPNPQRRD